jgi:hypothetical protein
MILGFASSESLVLIDELGRATAPKEGVGISHAIAENLIKLKVNPFHSGLPPSLTHVLLVLHLLCYVRYSLFYRLVLWPRIEAMA